MTRYKITLEYDGTDLIGWQQNRQGPSVQSLIMYTFEKTKCDKCKEIYNAK